MCLRCCVPSAVHSGLYSYLYTLQNVRNTASFFFFVVMRVNPQHLAVLRHTVSFGRLYTGMHQLLKSGFAMSFFFFAFTHLCRRRGHYSLPLKLGRRSGFGLGGDPSRLADFPISVEAIISYPALAIYVGSKEPFGI